jgi:DNA helicase HerA-like ATPase
MDQLLGRVTAVAGSQLTVTLDSDPSDEKIVRIGAMVKVRTANFHVVGNIRGVQFDNESPPRRTLIVEPLGEISVLPITGVHFSRGITHYPVPGDPVFAATEDDFTAVYERPSVSNIRIGTLFHDEKRPAYAQIDEMLSKHFAILGTTGSGKSCAVTLILTAVLAEHPNAHVILLDAHNEYSTAFGDLAEVLNVDNLRLPFWLLDLEEAGRVLIRGGSPHEQETQLLILKDAITRARRHYAGENGAVSSITVDTPVPYQIPDVIRFLNEGMGALNKPDTSLPYLRLRSRLESLRDDRRYAFMFSDWFNIPDRLEEIVGRFLRIPVAGKPLTILDLSGVPFEVADVVVSLSCRIMFDFALWAEREHAPPVLLVCEEAHRYAPIDERRGFAATTRALTRIAKEGRKYGVSLGLVSQRPSELSPDALSQCGTVFSLRLANDRDQAFVERVLPDPTHGMLDALPTLRTQDAIVCGEGVPVAMRIRFDHLPIERRPSSKSAEFSKAWQSGAPDEDYRAETIRRWRLQSRHSETPTTATH